MSGVRRVFAGVHGSLGSLQALRYAANEARYRGARLLPVIAWVPPGGDLAERRQPNLYLRKMSQRPRDGSGKPSTWDWAACPKT